MTRETVNDDDDVPLVELTTSPGFRISGTSKEKPRLTIYEITLTTVLANRIFSLAVGGSSLVLSDEVLQERHSFRLYSENVGPYQAVLATCSAGDSCEIRRAVAVKRYVELEEPKTKC